MECLQVDFSCGGCGKERLVCSVFDLVLLWLSDGFGDRPAQEMGVYKWVCSDN